MHFNWTAISTVLLTFVSTFCEAEKDAGPSFFTAAVFEHRHRHDIETDSVEEVKIKNLNFFEKAIEVAAEKEADIILFNEFGTFPYSPDRSKIKPFMEHVPNPEDGKLNPCDDRSKFKDSLTLVTLSCMAKRHSMYVVANMGDQQPCNSEHQTCDLENVDNCDMNESQCPDDGVFLYNTNVVFNREGYLIARYHKVHPYFEQVNTPEVAEYSYFSTDFGVFGLIICFDSMFKEAVNLVEKYGIETMLFPTLWFDDISPLNAVELQQAWALSNNVNFIAANGHYPGEGTLGSGIYSKYFGALKYSYNPDGESKLLVAKVPRRKDVEQPPIEKRNEVIVITNGKSRVQEDTGENFSEHCLKRIMGEASDYFVDYRCSKQQLSRYSVEKLESPSGVVKKCQNGMCCSVSYSAESMDEDYYLAVFNGTNDDKDSYFWCEESCLLVRCDSFNGKPCAILPSKSKTVFHSIKMKASFTADRIYPTVLQTRNRLAPKSEWKFEIDDDSATLKIASESRVPLLKAGLVGRCYDRDPPFKSWY